ncbi:MAG: DUF2058 family protein, partial [Gammaproteobacteria bacterium]|nr:DUF2058 family protein [Gammaproteobacteria bacterium]
VAPAETHFIVSREHADEILKLFADSFVFNASEESVAGSGTAQATEDDPYADYKVPDDLTW